MKLSNSNANHNTKFHVEVRINRKLDEIEKRMDILSYFFSKDFQIALRSATQNFKLKLDSAVYRLERVKHMILVNRLTRFTKNQ